MAGHRLVVLIVTYLVERAKSKPRSESNELLLSPISRLEPLRAEFWASDPLQPSFTSCLVQCARCVRCKADVMHLRQFFLPPIPFLSFLSPFHFSSLDDASDGKDFARYANRGNPGRKMSATSSLQRANYSLPDEQTANSNFFGAHSKHFLGIPVL